jgi:hypothetical protein
MRFVAKKVNFNTVFTADIGFKYLRTFKTAKNPL